MARQSSACEEVSLFSMYRMKPKEKTVVDPNEHDYTQPLPTAPVVLEFEGS
jgi:hypothetical protein